MVGTTTASIWGVTVALGVAAAAIGTSEGRYRDESHLLQQACAGLPSSRQVEDALASMRGLSNDGSDPVCTQLSAEATSARVSQQAPWQGLSFSRALRELEQERARVSHQES